ncbi:Oxidoreductase family, NAD-binding Rossmann fold [Gracilibacillus ureilyticus]|uniref:Oxidoreductase family, NAD-binding Rossmann fold n=1 Tax=Gracilibacillus ureilyticus TaxID=531814 RepID=A0A1H9MQ00_9BACI|nr:Gfo/Idh/MocA family oxidoreductase [Gracilibacillus ureilyticus]SER25762.1 Oxidoreductase family, NAD-binding Rossmann fold [Gracilibacillus ureilyticus]
MSGITNFSIVGGAGFRARYFLRVAKALPNVFRVSGAVVRDEGEGKHIEKEWGIKTYRTLRDLLTKESPDFAVISVNPKVCAQYLIELAELNIPALAETPPAPDLAGLINLHEKLTVKDAKVQVAEQYQFHPSHQARLSLIESGRLGRISESTVSISHLYHGVSLLRRILQIGFEDAEIHGKRFHSRIIAGPSRAGYPEKEESITAARDLVWLDFGDKLGIYDFEKDQHRSWIRSNHLRVRGERGEIFDDRVHMLADYETPIHLDLKRINKGEKENQEGHFLYGILAGEKWVYKNPHIPARLYDDEIAIATCLTKMAEYIKGGPSFYDLREASQDHYIGMLMQQALETGEIVKSVKQPWAE